MTSPKCDWTEHTLKSPCITPCILLKCWVNYTDSFQNGSTGIGFHITILPQERLSLTTVSVLRGVDVWVVHPSQTRGIVLSWCYCVRHDPFIQVRFIWHYCVISRVIPGCTILIQGSFVCFVIEYTERVYAVITTCLWKNEQCLLSPASVHPCQKKIKARVCNRRCISACTVALLYSKPSTVKPRLTINSLIRAYVPGEKPIHFLIRKPSWCGNPVNTGRFTNLKLYESLQLYSVYTVAQTRYVHLNIIKCWLKFQFF